jgi:hypothetical protein
VSQIEEAEIPDVHLINRKQCVAVLTNGYVVPVTHWFGTGGEDCEPDQAVVCVAGDETFGWYTVDLVAFDYVTVH